MFEESRISPRLMQFIVAVVIAVAVTGFMALRSLKTGPFGRRQFVDMSHEQQVALGAQAFRQSLAQSNVVPRGPVVREVEEVTGRLEKATKNPAFLKMTGLPDRQYPWEVKVVESREVNAFCLPGGKMVVYTGILPVCANDAGLATVMGHELSHALGQHGAERMTQAKLANIGVAITGAGLGGMDPRDQQRVMQLINAGAQFGIMSYGRKHESEADRMGLYLMAAAGYDPEESVKFWERMKAKSGGGKTPEFLSTHPSHETRIRDLMKWIPEAKPLYEASPYRTETKRLQLR